MFVAKPSVPTNNAEPTSPAMMSGRRPTRSDHDPENCRTMALPAAKAARATPDVEAPLAKMAAANRGRTATRTPMLIQPWAKFDVSTAR